MLQTAPVPPPIPLPKSTGWRTAFKLVVMGILVLGLLIPLAMIRAVLAERSRQRDQVIAGIAATWGRDQTVFGPVLAVPYTCTTKALKPVVSQGVTQQFQEVLQTETAYAWFLPEQLDVTCTLEPSHRYRGIYKAVVYNGEIRMSGSFAPPDFGDWRVNATNVLWQDAELLFGITDLRGTRQVVTVEWDGQRFPCSPSTSVPFGRTGVKAAVGPALAEKTAERWDFAADFTLTGSRGIHFAPVGVSNRVEVASPWTEPSFDGGFLPVSRTINTDGFKAVWEMSYYGRKFPQRWRSSGGLNESDVTESLFGVSLLSPVDSYRIVERSIKYGVLIIVLTFTLFFLFELLARVRVHPLQYALVGAALCLFYLAFLSLSEFWRIGYAYVTGAAVCTAMIVLYMARRLGSARRSLALLLGLGALYGFLYLVLQSQDYSLIIGTVGLFAALGLIMYATRGIDWYAREKSEV